MTEEQIHFGPFRCDSLNACLWRDEQAIPLTPKAFAVLLYLLRHPGRLVRKDELLKMVWAETYVGDAVLKVSVGEIRKALGDDPKTPQFIATIHRRGYRFIAPLTVTASPSLESRVRRLALEDQDPPSFPVQTLDVRRQTLDIPLVGRERELARLHELRKQALRGERQIVFVTGESGIGKTAVIDTFLSQMTGREMLTAHGACLEHYGAGEAYLPILAAIGQLCREPGRKWIIELLERYAPTWLAQLPALVSPANRERLQREVLGATPERMLREMAEALEALTRETLLILVLEDLHWSDYATLDLLAAVARRREATHLMIIGSYRPVDVVVSEHPLKSLKQELQGHGQCEEVALDLLTPNHVATYLAARFPQGAFPEELATIIHRRTDGNPLFLINFIEYLAAQNVLRQQGERWELSGTLHQLEEGMPESIRQMLERQLERLPPEAQRIVEAASVVGIEFAAATVGSALEAPEGAIEECCERLARQHQFLRVREPSAWPDGTVTASYGFTHSLYQHVLFQRVAAMQRLRFHQRIGERLEKGYGAQAKAIAAELAVHFVEGRDYHRAVQYLRQAAANEVRRYANREAIGYLIRALGLVERLPEPEERVRLRLSILEQLGLARRALGDRQGAAEDFAALIAYAREQGQLEWEIRAGLYSAAVLSWVDHESCLTAAEQAVALSRRLTDAHLHVHARAYYGYWRTLLHGWRDEDAQVCAEAVKLARQTGDHALLSLHIGRHLYFQCLQSPYRIACRTAEEELQTALTAGDAHDYMTCQFFHAWALLHAGQWSVLLSVLREGEQIVEKNPHLVWGMHLRLMRAWLYEQAGDFARARELSEEGLAQALEAKHQYTQLLSLIMLGWAYLGLEEYERAFRSFKEITQLPERILMDWILRMPLHHGLSAYWLARREFDQARQEASRLSELARQPGEHTYLALGQRMLAEIALAEQNWDQAEAVVSSALVTLDGVEAPLAEWRVYATAARLAEHRCRKTEAQGYWLRSATVVDRLAGSFAPTDPLRQTFLAQRAVQEVLRHVETS